MHLLVDADLMPLSTCPVQANKDKMKNVGNLIDTVAEKTGKEGRQRKKMRNLAAYKGYDTEILRNFFKKNDIRPLIP